MRVFRLLPLLLMFACEQDIPLEYSSSPQGKPGIEKTNLSPTGGVTQMTAAYESGSEWSDWSGTVHVKVFRDTWYNSQWHTDRYVPVSSEYVCVGGGAITSQNGYGALLTATYPDLNLYGWYASSKDHKKVSFHDLTVYAIGLRVDGLTANQLRSQLEVIQTTSPNEISHPSVSTPGINDTNGNRRYVIGGGAKVVNGSNDYGSLLTHCASREDVSLISNNLTEYKWFAKSKDHFALDPAKITAYAILLPPGNEIAGFGTLQTIAAKGYSGANPGGYLTPGSTGAVTATATTPVGYVVTCPGGTAVTTEGPGRLLFGVIPNIYSSTQTQAMTTDHLVVSRGHTYAMSINVRKKP